MSVWLLVYLTITAGALQGVTVAAFPTADDCLQARATLPGLGLNIRDSRCVEVDTRESV